MATIKLVILQNHPLKDGSFKIRVAVSHKHKTSYITTRYKVEKANQFNAGQVVNTNNAHLINKKLRQLLNDYEEKLYNIDNLDLYTCSQLRQLLLSSSMGKAATFMSITNDYISDLKKDKRENYALLLERNARYFTEFCKGDILMESITPTIIENYSRYLKHTRNLSDSSVGMQLSRTRTIINRAIKRQMVSYTAHPFLNIKIAAAPIKELDITIPELKKIRDSQPKEKKLIVARDAFMLSYYLGGVNLIDLLSYDFRNTTRFEYIRTKSRNQKQGEKRISFTIQPEAEEIIRRYRNRNTGKIDFGYKYSYQNLSRYITRNIVLLAKQLNIQSKVVYYSARKSFVQHGFDLGISLEVLEYCIGQSVKQNRPIFNYLRIMRTHADDAIRKILDNLE